MFPDDISEILKHRGLLDDATRFVRDHERSAYRLKARRVSDRPLQPGFFDKLFGKKPAQPKLPITASKWGGTPYQEGEGLEGSHDFLGQINFADLDGTAENLPERGILTLWVPHNMLDLGLTTRWFPEPSSGQPSEAKCVGKWETELTFEPIAIYPEGDLWMSFLGPSPNDDELEEAWFCAQERIGDSTEHQLGGWPRAGLYENYGFDPGPEGSIEIDDWEMLLSISFDNEAGFGWGTNVVYVIAKPDALAAANLSDVIVTAANY